MNKIQVLLKIRYIALAALAACCLAGRANAQVFTGDFTLSTETRWQGAVLPAGDYTLSLDHASIDGVVRLYRGRTPVGIFPVQGQNTSGTERAELTVEQGTIRGLTLPHDKVVLLFLEAPHKRYAGPKDRQLVQLIPISHAGK